MPRRGSPTKGDPLLLCASILVLPTGLLWRDLPERYKPWPKLYAHYRRWCATGLFARMLAVLAEGTEVELRHLDCSHIKLHQNGANPQKRADGAGDGAYKGRF